MKCRPKRESNQVHFLHDMDASHVHTVAQMAKLVEAMVHVRKRPPQTADGKTRRCEMVVKAGHTCHITSQYKHLSKGKVESKYGLSMHHQAHSNNRRHVPWTARRLACENAVLMEQVVNAVDKFDPAS
jgi:hypothetical protein